jgi:hypothetical protein
MIGAPDLTITDSGNRIVRQLSFNRSENIETGSVITALNNMSKVTYSSNGIVVADNANKELLYLFNSGELINKLPISQPVSVAIGYERNHQLLYQPIGETTLKHLFVEKTAKQAGPTALAKKFVQAYLDDNEAVMLEITTQRWIARLNKQDTKVREVFTNISTYDETIYMHGLQATVFVKTLFNNQDVTIKMNFVWANGQWVLNRVN